MAIFETLANIKTVYDMIEVVYSTFGTEKEDEISEPLKASLQGSSASARDANARLINILKAPSLPFMLRCGKNFNIPAGASEMQEAILDAKILDWSYVFNYDKNVPFNLVQNLKESYFDGELYKKDLETTYLGITQNDFPKEFGDSIYIVGTLLMTSEYKKITYFETKDITPLIILKIEGNNVYSYSDPIVMSYMLNKLLDLLYNIESDIGEKYLCFNKTPTQEQRTPSIAMQNLFR